mgnify:CR=1 FL=1
MEAMPLILRSKMSAQQFISFLLVKRKGPGVSTGAFLIRVPVISAS